MENFYCCDSCNGEFRESMGVITESAIGLRFYCNHCSDIEDDCGDDWEYDDPMSYREDH